MKRPSFQFYPSDWLRDTALRSCSTGARGLWIDMICFMHEGNPYGHLKVGNKVILPSNLASMVGATLHEVEGWLDELRQAGVYELAEDGEIYSKRMVRDEYLRNKRAEGGKLGGNPNLKVNLKVIPKVENKVKQISTPSSSSSSSSSNSIRASRLPTNFEFPVEWKQWANQQRSDIDVNLEADSFKDYWSSKNGTDAAKTDWFATWRNWVRRAKGGITKTSTNSIFRNAI
jgi:hypothetical protein